MAEATVAAVMAATGEGKRSMKMLILMSAYIHTLLCPLDATPLPAYQYVYGLPKGTQTVVWVSTKRGEPKQFQCVYVTRGNELKADLETGKEKT